MTPYCHIHKKAIVRIETTTASISILYPDLFKLHARVIFFNKLLILYTTENELTKQNRHFQGILYFV